MSGIHLLQHSERIGLLLGGDGLAEDGHDRIRICLSPGGIQIATAAKSPRLNTVSLSKPPLPNAATNRGNCVRYCNGSVKSHRSTGSAINAETRVAMTLASSLLSTGAIVAGYTQRSYDQSVPTCFSPDSCPAVRLVRQDTEGTGSRTRGTRIQASEVAVRERVGTEDPVPL